MKKMFIGKKIHILFSLCLFITLGMCLPAHAEPVNVTPDGNMEGNVLTPWVRYGQPSLLEKNSEIFFEGTKSIHVISSNVNGRGGVQQLNIPVQAGQTYTVQVRYFIKHGLIRTWLGIQNSNAAFDGRIDTLAGNENQWQLFERQVTIPNTFIQDFRLMFNTQDAEAYIDDVRIFIPEPLQEPEDPEQPEEEENPEPEHQGEVVDADMEALHADSWINYKEPSLKEKSVENHSGNQSLHFVTPRVEGRIQNSSGVQQTNLSAQPGKTYTWSFWYKNTADLLPRIGIQNSDEDFEFALEPGIAPILSPTNEWTYYERTFVVPENFLTDLRLVFVVYDVQSSADWSEVVPLEQGSAFIDDVRLTLIQNQEENPNPDQENNPDQNNPGFPQNSSPVFGSPILVPPVFSKTYPYPTNPFLPVVEIDGGVTTTASSTITLKFNIQNVTHMGISNTFRFEEYDIVPFTSSTQWTLTEGNGEKTIHILFKSQSGGTIRVFETITVNIPETNGMGGFPLDLLNQESVFENPLPDQSLIPCPLSPHKIYKSADTENMYVVTQSCTKQKISPEVFSSYSSKSPAAFLILEHEIKGIPDYTGDIIPFGKDYLPKTGDLLKAYQDTKIYLILNNKKYWIRSQDIFTDLGFSLEKVKTVIPQVLFELDTAEPLG